MNLKKTTSERVTDFMLVHRLTGKYKEAVQTEMAKVNYNAESDENKQELIKMIEWLNDINNDSQYISNLKITIADGYCEHRDFGLVCSLPSAYFKAFEREQERLAREQRKAEIEALNGNKQYIGKIGERLDFDIYSVNCVISFPTDYGMMRIYRFDTTDGNVLVWKTSNFIENTDEVKKIKATVKKHTEYNSEKQTELSRVKILG